MAPKKWDIKEGTPFLTTPGTFYPPPCFLYLLMSFFYGCRRVKTVELGLSDFRGLGLLD